MEILQTFSEDYAAINSIGSIISNKQAYIIGYTRGLYQQDIESSMDFLKDLNQCKAMNLLKEKSELFLLFKIYQGNLQEAESILSTFKEINCKEMFPDLLTNEDKEIYTRLQSRIIIQPRAEPIPPEEVNCPICLDTIPDSDLLPLEQCGDMFHTSCMYKHLEIQVESRNFPLLCPIPTCKTPIHMLDLKERLGPYLLELFENYTFQNYVQTHSDECSCCPTADCTYVFMPDGTTELTCPRCYQHYCLRCKCIYHNSYSCEEYQAANGDISEIEFMRLVKGAKYKQCPKCRFWVEKSEGCDHMTCRCKFEFCYKCGGVYRQCGCM